jgi:type II secretory pathway predicted ATPase ExeA
LDQRPSKRSLADDPQFSASLSDLDNGLSRPLEQQIDTIDSLSEAMWSEVAAQWDAFAPAASPRTSPSSDAVVPPVRVDTPFDAAPDLRFLYHSAEHDRALSELMASVTRRETVVVVTGERGAGKTTLCRSLVEHLDRRTLVSVVTAPASVDALLKRLLVDFGVISNDETARQLESASHEDLSGALRDFLSSLSMLEASALVIVDDAHVLTREVWEELSAIGNMADGPRLQMLLAGEPELKRAMRRSDAGDMARRVAFRVEVGPLHREEIHGYVPHRLAVAGRADQVRFDDVALREVFSLTGGVPGAINAICDRALTLAAHASSSRIDAATIAEAAGEVGVVRTLASKWRERAVFAVVLILMLIAGAAGAGWVFREPLNRALAAFSGNRTR